KMKMFSGLLQLSVAVAAYVTLRPAGLLHSTVWLAGHTICGGSFSSITTAKLHTALFPLLSVAVQFTVDVPAAKVDPLGGAHELVTPGQLSVAFIPFVPYVTFVFEH